VPFATVASLAAFVSVVADEGVHLSSVNGSQELTAESVWFGSAPATYLASKA
jgi:hypothetical protein